MNNNEFINKYTDGHCLSYLEFQVVAKKYGIYFEKINNDIKSQPDQTILNNKIEIIYTAPSGLRIGLEINSNDEQNKISEISCIAY